MASDEGAATRAPRGEPVSSAARIRWVLGALLTSPCDRAPPYGRVDAIAAALALLVGTAVFAFKLKFFHELAYRQDVFAIAQHSTSWLDGRLLADNCYGNVLATHSYFVALPIGLVVRGLGVPGLFLVLAVAMALGSFWATRILHSLGVPAAIALPAGPLLLGTPFSVAFVHDEVLGFNHELLVPPLALGLLHALLQRRTAASVVAALVLVSIKEDVTLVVGWIGAIALVETFLARFDPARRREPGHLRAALNGPALLVIAIAAVALPILLHVIQAQARAPLAPGTEVAFDRPPVLREAGVHGGASLVRFVLTHLDAWASSAVGRWFPWLAFVGTFGLALLRPHYLPFGFSTTLVAWLMHDSLLRPARFAAALAFLWCVSLLGLASLVRAARRASGGRPVGVPLALGTWAVLVAVLAHEQLVRVPSARDVYALEATRLYRDGDIERADALFLPWRATCDRRSPVLATLHLFRYAHDKNVHWRIRASEPPVWILWDDEMRGLGSAIGERSSEYAVVARSGRFSIYRRRGA